MNVFYPMKRNLQIIFLKIDHDGTASKTGTLWCS